MKLTQEKIDFFFENGYLKYGAVLEAEEMETLRREYDLEFLKADASCRNLSESEGSAADDKEKSPQKMLQITQICERNIHFRKAVFNDQILDVVEELMGPGIMLFHDQALFKPAKTGGPVPWHQDNGYWNCSPANLISCWIALDDAYRENGAMQVLPGSHLKPYRHAELTESNRLREIQAPVDESKVVVVDLKAGECLFHHCQTLHYTQPNTTEHQRRAFIIHFMVPGTRKSSGERIPIGFSHPVLRLSI
jgi:ectoine hydroxylase-related dioxygenase (phytanoyl-CoA dioxygenase family)